MPPTSPGTDPPRRAEVLAALSVAIDLGLGQPAEHMLRSAVIACHLADRLDLPEEQRGTVYYTTLVMWIGCHADSQEYARWFGDDIAVRNASYLVDWSGLPYLKFLLGNGDAFIDHPTDAWVKANLPAELRETAYRLPANCADIVVILRHVWLFAHKRSENYRGFVVGFVSGESAGARSKRVGRDIAAISTATLSTMINPYTDASGKPLRSVTTLTPLLHPGDILLWAHHDGTPLNGPRTGGHSQTIVSIARTGGAIAAVETLQGNEPLPPEAKQFRHTPGRRIERGRSIVPQDVMVPGKGRQPANRSGPGPTATPPW